MKVRLLKPQSSQKQLRQLHNEENIKVYNIQDIRLIPLEDTKKEEKELIFYCDNQRHLVCQPYSIANLHKMAETLKIKRCWYHAKKGREHYDIPKKRIKEITEKCRLVSPLRILTIIDPINALL